VPRGRHARKRGKSVASQGMRAHRGKLSPLATDAHRALLNLMPAAAPNFLAAFQRVLFATLIPALATLMAIAAAGCSHLDRMKPTIAAFESGAYAKAESTFEPLLEGRRESNKDRTLYELEGGMIFAAAGDTERSMGALNYADEEMWKYLDEAPDVRVTEQAAAILTNQTVVTYRGTTYDRVMCSTYQALNHLARGNLEAAGVSLRRAYEWQRDAVEKNAKEIEALEEKANAAGASKGYDAKAAQKDPTTRAGLESAYGEIRDMKGYAEFAVPYSTYLQALRFQLTGRSDEMAQATVAYRRVVGMLPDADRAYVEEDAKLAEAVSQGAPMPSMVYVLCETGMAPELVEFKISIPLFIRQVPYVGAAFPVLKFQSGGTSSFIVRAGNARYSSSTLTDMDSVIGGDFNRRLPAIITMTLVSSATKAIATYIAEEAANRSSKTAAWIASIGGAIYQLATNSADLRTWLTLPKQVLYARFPAPAEGSFEVDLGDGQKIGPIAVESGGTTIVHVRAPRAGAPPAVRTMRFPQQR
jgi:hypothetical protein